MCTSEFRSSGLDTYSEKTREDPKLSTLTNLNAPDKQEVKGKTELLTAWLNAKSVPTKANL